MKKTIFALLALILLALVASCGATTRETPSEIQDYPPVEGLSVTITKATADRIIFTVRNDSDTEYLFAPRYTPEKRLPSGKWAPVEPLEGVLPAYDTILWPIPPGKTREMDFAWALTYGSFPDGEYRILVQLLPDGALCVPFTLPNDTGGVPWTLVKSDKPIAAQSQVTARAFNVTPTGLTLSIRNGSQSAINLGSEYFLQLWQDGVWYDLDVGPLDWVAELMTVRQGQEAAVTLHWTGIYGALPDGLYRLVKEYWPGGESGKSGYVFCEFLLPPSDAAPGLDTLLCPRGEITELRLLLERSFTNSVSVVANETERAALLDLLYAADIGAFEDADAAGVSGTGFQFTVRTADGERDLRLLSDGGAQYVLVTDLATFSRSCKKGPAGAFDFEGLDRLYRAVLANTDDPDWSGTVSIPAMGYTASVHKADCAYARTYLDGAIDAAADGAPGAEYDVEFRTGGVVYELDSETGACRRDDSGAVRCGTLDAQALVLVRTHLGVLSRTSWR